MEKKITRTIRVRTGHAKKADYLTETFTNEAFTLLEDEAVPMNGLVESDRLVTASMTLSDFFKAATIKEKK